MCVPYEAMPPVRAITGAAVDSESLTLTAADGNQFAAFAARSGETGPAVVVLPDVRGLFPFYEELALRFAERGYDSVAMDYFGRSAGVGRRDAEFDYGPHVAQTIYGGLRDDVRACVDYLRQADAARPIFTIGFCFGGSGSWQQAAQGHGLSGAIGFYGHPTRGDRPQGAPAVVDLVPDFECPVLGLMGGGDPGIGPDVVEQYRVALEVDDHPHELHTYPGAPHSFFDRAYEEFAAESEDAWERVLAFIEAHA